MDSDQNQRQEHKLLLFAFIFGIVTLILGLTGLSVSRSYPTDFSWSLDYLDYISSLIFDSVRILLLDPPAIEQINGWLIASRICAVLFALFGILGIILELSQTVSDVMLRIWFRILRLFGRKAAVVVGLGEIGAPLALELRKKGRPVYSFVQDEPIKNLRELRKAGVLIIEDDIIGRMKKRSTSSYIYQSFDIFLTLNDDSFNLELAGDIIDFLPNYNDDKDDEVERYCYLHIGGPDLSKTVEQHQLLKEHGREIIFVPFSITGLTSIRLFIRMFLDQKLGLLSVSDKESEGDLPLRLEKDELFHLFIFGFGQVGQSIALHTARFAHFPSSARPRLTIFGEESLGKKPWESFIQKHPAFSPFDLDLGVDAFKKAGDAWGSCPARPRDIDFQTAEIAKEQNPPKTAVEYAVNAEYLPIINEVDACSLLNIIRDRMAQLNPGIQAAVVFCIEDEHENFHSVLRFQKELAKRLLEENQAKDQVDFKLRNQYWKNLCPLPIFAHLPTEDGLALMLNDAPEVDEWKFINKELPIHSFGQLSDLINYDLISKGEIKELAQQIREVYKILSQQTKLTHVDFDSSDMDSVLFSEVKMHALGIRFYEKKLDSRKPLLDGYFGEEIERELKEFRKQGYVNDEIVTLDLDLLEGILNSDEKPKKQLLDRLAMMGKLKVANEKSLSKVEKDKASHLKNAAVRRVLVAFTQEYNNSRSDTESGPEADLAAEMEHNRWMGERLAKNWRYGPERSNFLNERSTFVPWEELTENERSYDRQQIPRVILAQRKMGIYAYVE